MFHGYSWYSGTDKFGCFPGGVEWAEQEGAAKHVAAPSSAQHAHAYAQRDSIRPAGARVAAASLDLCSLLLMLLHFQSLFHL